MWIPNIIFTVLLTITVGSAMPNKQEDKKPKFLKPYCITNSDCPDTRACKNSTCINPCNLWCAEDSVCEVANHVITKCSCPENKIGDPLVGCKDVDEEGGNPFVECKATEDIVTFDPCLPSPCGPNSFCWNINDQPACDCITGYLGHPPNCRLECTITDECSDKLACINQHCRDPCLGACGDNALCVVEKHVPVCTCPTSFTGNPFTKCSKIGENMREHIENESDNLFNHSKGSNNF